MVSSSIFNLTTSSITLKDKANINSGMIGPFTPESLKEFEFHAFPIPNHHFRGCAVGGCQYLMFPFRKILSPFNGICAPTWSSNKKMSPAPAPGPDFQSCCADWSREGTTGRHPSGRRWRCKRPPDSATNRERRNEMGWWAARCLTVDPYMIGKSMLPQGHLHWLIYKVSMKGACGRSARISVAHRAHWS